MNARGTSLRELEGTDADPQSADQEGIQQEAHRLLGGLRSPRGARLRAGKPHVETGREDSDLSASRRVMGERCILGGSAF